MKHILRRLLHISRFSLLLSATLILSSCSGVVPAITTEGGSKSPKTTEKPAAERPSVSNATAEEITTDPMESEEPQWVLNITNRCTYTPLPSGVVARKIIIKTHHGTPSVKISHMTDTHIIYYSNEDLKDPILKESYDLLGGSSHNGWPLSNVQATMKEASRAADMIVVTGDVVARYSPGALQKTREYIFDAAPNVMATLGNHDTERIAGNQGDPLSEEERRALIAKDWCNDISYASTVLEEKVMVIALDNGHGFRQEQYVPFASDLALAREMGYVVLLFYHVPLNSGLASDNNIPPEYGTHENWSFGTANGCVGPDSTGIDGKMYSLIRRNGDIIRGLFCGHVHGDFYTEIPAKTIDGIDTMIPQYVTAPVYAEKGHYLHIVVE